MNDTIRTALLNLYGSSGFRRSWDSNWLYHGIVDGITVGVVIATYNARYNNYSLNKKEFERLLAALDSGKVREAYAVMTKKRTCIELTEARKLWAKLKDVEPIDGEFGEFWPLPSFSDEGDPFAVNM
jgi:hypothetical protein